MRMRFAKQAIRHAYLCICTRQTHCHVDQFTSIKWKDTNTLLYLPDMMMRIGVQARRHLVYLALHLGVLLDNLLVRLLINPYLQSLQDCLQDCGSQNKLSLRAR